MKKTSNTTWHVIVGSGVEVGRDGFGDYYVRLYEGLVTKHDLNGVACIDAEPSGAQIKSAIPRILAMLSADQQINELEEP